MIVSVEIHNRTYRFDAGQPLDISIPLDFDGAQPNAYGVEQAESKPYEAEGIIGDTRCGGSCNFEQIKFIPHCNGTHTESIGHITNERIAIRDCLKDSFVLARLISVNPETASEMNESYPVGLAANDKLITKNSILKVLDKVSLVEKSIQTASNKDSGTVNKELSTSNRDSGTVNKELSTINKETSIANKGTNTVNKETGSVNEESSTVNKETGSTNEETSITNRETITVNKESETLSKDLNAANYNALIVRTIPNDESKLSTTYLKEIPPFFSTEAMQFVREIGVKHLLVDLPSIDRLFDEGKLSNHRIFWNVEQGSFEANDETLIDHTITEMIYVPDEIVDRTYLLNLQIPSFVADAAPSRPLLFRLL